jgi:hypothetical protein
MLSQSTTKADQKQIAEEWGTDQLGYRGFFIFDKYMEFQDALAEMLDIGNIYESTYEETCDACDGTGERDGEECHYCEGDGWEEITERYTIDGQESYLGYDPSTDIFYSGWDIWGTDYCGESLSNVVSFKIDELGHIRDINIVPTLGGMMYSKLPHAHQSPYEQLHAVLVNLIDLRLD